MKKRKTLSIAGAWSVAGLLVLLAAPGSADAQVDWDQVEIKRHEVTDGIYMLQGRGGNIGVSIGADGIFLVDDQFAPLTEKIKAAVAEVAQGKPMRFVINTHYHQDHTNGNESMAGAGVLVVAHDNVRQRLSVEEWIRSLDEPAKGLPVVTFNDTVTFHINGDDVECFHVESAHTDGDSIVHFGNSNVVHMGDVYFNGLYPFIDIDGGGSADGVLAAVDAVLARSDAETKIIPGHGPLSNRAELVSYRDLLRDVRNRVAMGITAGKSLKQIQDGNPSADYDEQWGGGFIDPDTFVEFVYRDLTGSTATE